MKILLIVDDYLPHSFKVAAKMMHELALELKQQGHDITVLIPKTEQELDLCETDLDGIKILSFKIGNFKNTSKVKRAINETRFSIKGWRLTKSFFKKNPHDAIVYYSPSIFWGGLVGKLKKMWGVQSYMILRDLFPQWAVDNGLLSKKSLKYLYFKYFENINYRNADYIGVMSPSSKLFFKKQQEVYEKCEILYNWSKIEKTPPALGKHKARLGLDDKLVFFYGGNIGHAQNMMNLVMLSMRFKNNPQVHFLFVGQGDEFNLVADTIKKENLTNLTLLPPVNQKVYFEMLNDFDIGLFSLHPNHTTDNFPGKLLGYMSYCKPILGSVNAGNDLKDVINKNGAGFISDTGEDEVLYQNALTLIESPQLRTQVGLNGKKLLKKSFSVEETCNQIQRKLTRDK